jgi:hypothetical protein
MKQVSVRKDVECTFNLLKKRFNILAISDRSYSQRTLDLIMRAYIILHNMIIDDERDSGYDETITLSLSSLLHLSLMMHRLVLQLFFKG